MARAPYYELVHDLVIIVWAVHGLGTDIGMHGLTDRSARDHTTCLIKLC